MLDPNLSRYTLNGTLASANVKWSINSGTLPPGVTLDDLGHNTSNQSIAELAGEPTTPGKYSFTVQAATGSAVISLNDTLSVFGLTNAPMLPAPLSDTGFAATLDTATPTILYTEQLTTAGGTDPVTFSVDPAMIPNWLTVSNSGVITGTPGSGDANIDFYFDVKMTDAEGGVCTQTVKIPVQGPACFSTPFNLPDAPHSGLFYEAYLIPIQPHQAGYRYTVSLQSGTLPPGLILTVDNGYPAIIGIPTEIGSWIFTVCVDETPDYHP